MDIHSGHPVKVIVVGCGNICGEFDMNSTDVAFPLTHLGAYTHDSRFQVIACVEPDDVKRERFMQHWRIPNGFRSLEKMIDKGITADVISICSPTALHKTHISQSIKLKPKLIFCEKPVTESSGQTQEIISACNTSGILLAVNHNRRWDPELRKIKRALHSQAYGYLRSIAAYYNKGVLNNGSHLIDSLQYLLGDIQIIATAPARFDYSQTDATIAALLQSNSGIPIHLISGHAQDYSLFELVFLFSEGELSMEDGGLSWQWRASITSDTFNGYRVLDNRQHTEGGYKYAMQNALSNIYEAINAGKHLESSGDSALRAQQLCEKLLNWNQQQSVNEILAANDIT